MRKKNPNTIYIIIGLVVAAGVAAFMYFRKKAKAVVADIATVNPAIIGGGAAPADVLNAVTEGVGNVFKGASKKKAVKQILVAPIKLGMTTPIKVSPPAVPYIQGQNPYTDGWGGVYGLGGGAAPPVFGKGVNEEGPGVWAGYPGDNLPQYNDDGIRMDY